MPIQEYKVSEQVEFDFSFHFAIISSVLYFTSHEQQLTHVAQGIFYRCPSEITYNVQFVNRVGQYQYFRQIYNFILNIFNCRVFVNYHYNSQSLEIYSQFSAT
jgi:hypothetical protein